MSDTMKNTTIILLITISSLYFLLLSFFACSSQQDATVLDQDDVILVDSVLINRLCFHRNMSLVDSSFYPLIVEKIKLGIDSIGKHIKLTDVEFRVLVFPEKTIPGLGMSGAAPNGKHIYILLDNKHPKLKESLENEIIQTLAHEYHHTLRHRTVGYGENLFQSMISEGLACHFSMEVCKIDTPTYCKALTKEQFEEWEEKAKKEWFNSEFDHLEWFVGLKKTVPKNAGNTIGFKMVSDYLSKHSGQTAATLYDTPADSFLVRKNY
jgi:uncharacterized protein YjaZ